MSKVHLTTNAAERKAVPMARGLLDYFPDALAAVAHLSQIGNQQHNPGQPMHWSREKSTDHADCIMRHLVDRGKLDTDGVLHDVKVAWRALAQAQLAIEALANEEELLSDMGVEPQPPPDPAELKDLLPHSTMLTANGVKTYAEFAAEVRARTKEGGPF